MIASIRLGEILWSLLVIYLMIMYFVIVFTVWIDLIRSDDLSGGKKAIWVLALLIFPVISLVFYLISRGDGIGARQMSRGGSARGSGAVPPPPPSPATELSVAKQLLDSGAISQAEFDQLKARVLA